MPTRIILTALVVLTTTLVISCRHNRTAEELAQRTHTHYIEEVAYGSSSSMPNPFSPTSTPRFETMFTVDTCQPVSVQLMDTTGTSVWSLDSVFCRGGWLLVPPSDSLTSGIYFFDVTTPDTHFTHKTIIIK